MAKEDAMAPATTAGITILNPTSPPVPVNAKMAPAPKSLNGLRVGLLDNHKTNATLLLDEVYEQLSHRYEFASVMRRSKPDVSRPCPEETVRELAASVDLVITAIGD